MRVTAENLIANCNDLLSLTTKLKKLLLISDYQSINEEVRQHNMDRIDSIEQELNNFNSKDAPKKQFSAEDLIKATRPITDATTKAVVAGNNLKQDDIVAAANTGRKAICDLLVTCKVQIKHINLR